MSKQSKRDQIEYRRALACGGFDGESICRGAIECQCCGNCLLHCECGRRIKLVGARVQKGPQGEQLALCERPQLTWQGR
jgi:hypothetical protein